MKYFVLSFTQRYQLYLKIMIIKFRDFSFSEQGALDLLSLETFCFESENVLIRFVRVQRLIIDPQVTRRYRPRLG